MIGLVYKKDLVAAAELAAALERRLAPGRRMWRCPAGDLGSLLDTLEDTSTIITVGGDGTILRTVRVVAAFSIPILGINMGRVGFMTEIEAGDALEKVPAYLDGGCRVEERMMLRASVGPDGADGRNTLHALNDVVVARPMAGRLLDVDLSVDGSRLATYRADGVIVATPTGSTAYALSAGGPIISPQARVMLIQPIAAHMSFRAGLVVPDESVIEMGLHGDHQATLTADGFSNAALGQNDAVTVTRSPHVARFLRRGPPSDFYQTLARRLGMGAPASRPGSAS